MARHDRQDKMHVSSQNQSIQQGSRATQASQSPVPLLAEEERPLDTRDFDEPTEQFYI